MDLYEDYKPGRQLSAWLIILVISGLTIGWGAFVHMLVPETPRHWDFGALPDTPGQSAYATLPPPEGKLAPPQIQFPPDFAPEQGQEPATNE